MDCDLLSYQKECIVNVKNIMMKRVEDLEVRWSDTNRSYELVQWVQYEEGLMDIPNALDANEYCFVIAFFREGSEGCNIEFVGDRPFRYENRDRLWELMRYGQRICGVRFSRSRRMSLP